MPWCQAAYQVCYDWGMLHKVVHVPMQTPVATCTTACNVHQTLSDTWNAAPLHGTLT